MQALLFVDLLGARRYWQTGGLSEASEVFTRFARKVIRAVREEPYGAILDGGIENDSAMLVCDSSITALRIAQRLYERAFRNRHHPNSPRVWLRGSLVPNNGARFLRRESRIHSPLETMKIYTYSSPSLSAISIEKSGFKGMRLLVVSDLVDASVKEAFKLPFDGYSFIPFRRLRHSGYPDVVEYEMVDFLWMATNNDEQWNAISMDMTCRLRYSSMFQGEFEQAAATQVVFHECGAIRQSVMSRAQRASAQP